MLTCNFCKISIAAQYYRVGPVMACPECVAREETKVREEKWRHFSRGLVFAMLAAGVAFLAKWGFEAMCQALSLNGGLFSAGAIGRGFLTLFAGVGIAVAANKGARNRRTRALQVSTVILTYLAFCLPFVLLIMGRMPTVHVRAMNLLTVIGISLVIPFIAVFKNPIAITGLFAIGTTLMLVWAGLADLPELSVSGPFNVRDDFAEKLMFRSA